MIAAILAGFGISASCGAITYFLLVGVLLILVMGPALGQSAASGWATTTEARIKRRCACGQARRVHGGHTRWNRIGYRCDPGEFTGAFGAL